MIKPDWTYEIMWRTEETPWRRVAWDTTEATAIRTARDYAGDAGNRRTRVVNIEASVIVWDSVWDGGREL